MFTAAMFDPASLNKSDNGATGLAPGDEGQPSYDGPRALPAGQWHPDPSVTDVRGGARAGQPTSAATLRGNTSTAPGEPVTTVAVPAIVKADSRTAEEMDRNGVRPILRDRNGQSVSPAYRDRPSTSGSATPLAANRHATRPGAGRHPSTGRFTEGQGIAAGHASLDQKPSGSGVFPAAGDGPFAAQVHDPMTRPPRYVGPGSTLELGLAEHASTVGARRLDLRTPAGLPDGLRNVPDPTPTSRVQTGLNSIAGQRVQATPGDIPHPPGSPQWGGPDPLATAIQAHGSGTTAFGVMPGDVSCGFKEPG